MTKKLQFFLPFIIENSYKSSYKGVNKCLKVRSHRKVENTLATKCYE